MTVIIDIVHGGDHDDSWWAVLEVFTAI